VAAYLKGRSGLGGAVWAEIRLSLSLQDVNRSDNAANERSKHMYYAYNEDDKTRLLGIVPFFKSIPIMNVSR